jgi:hypothetical protein
MSAVLNPDAIARVFAIPPRGTLGEAWAPQDREDAVILLRAAKPHLSTGEPTDRRVNEFIRNEFICNAISIAAEDDEAEDDLRDLAYELRELISTRLNGDTYGEWLCRRQGFVPAKPHGWCAAEMWPFLGKLAGIPTDDVQRHVQASRLAWMDSLIEEFSA